MPMRREIPALEIWTKVIAQETFFTKKGAVNCRQMSSVYIPTPSCSSFSNRPESASGNAHVSREAAFQCALLLLSAAAYFNIFMAHKKWRKGKQDPLQKGIIWKRCSVSLSTTVAALCLSQNILLALIQIKLKFIFTANFLRYANWRLNFQHAARMRLHKFLTTFLPPRSSWIPVWERTRRCALSLNLGLARFDSSSCRNSMSKANTPGELVGGQVDQLYYAGARLCSLFHRLVEILTRGLKWA